MQTTITNTVVAKAKADARPGAARYEVTDAKARGLVLRVGPAGAQWQYRYQVGGRSIRLPLGSVDQWSITDAREIAQAAAAALRSPDHGLPDQGWLKAYLLKSRKIQPAPAAPEGPTYSRTWRWEQGRDAYLAQVLRTKRPSTHADYRGFLNHAALAPLAQRPLVSITRQEISAIVAEIHATGTEASAEHLARVISPFFRWLAEDAQAKKSGVAAGVMTSLRAPERTLDEKPKGKYAPPLEEVARIIAIARSGALDPSIGCAIELLCWSLQRRRAVASAEPGQFERIGDGRGLWLLPPASRKSRTKSGAEKRPHVIPLPEAAFGCVARAEELAHVQGSAWLFPQARARRAGDQLTHVNGSTLTHILSYLPGVQASPHDLRRAFGTHGEKKLGLLRADTRAILDHGSDSSDVTGAHYSLHDGTHRTWAIMQTWADALVPLIDQAVATLEPVEEIKAAIAASRTG